MTEVATDVHDTAEQRLRASGQRYTDQRRRLVDILARAGSPVALPDILRGRRDLAQSSVYRNLARPGAAGVVRRVMVDDEHGRYELTEDLTGHHHHLICSICGRVQDLPCRPTSSARSTGRSTVWRGSAGFAEVSHRLDLIGLCGECATASR